MEGRGPKGGGNGIGRNQPWRNSLRRYTSDVQTMRKQISRARTPSEVERLQRELDRAKRNVDALLGSSGEEASRYNAAKREFNAQMNSAQRVLANQAQALQKLQENLNRSRAAEAAAQRTLANKNATIEQKNAALEAARQASEDALEAARAAHNTYKATALKRQQENHERKLGNLRSIAVERQKRFQQVATELQNARRLVNELNRNKTASNTQRNAAQQALASAQANLERVKANASSLTAQQKKQINALTQQAAQSAENLQAHIRNKEVLSTRLATSNRLLRNAVRNVEQLSKNKNTSNAQRNAANKALANARANHERALANAHRQVTAAQEQAARNLQAQANRHAQNLQNLQFAHEASGAALNAATRKLANANVRVANLTQRANASNANRRTAAAALTAARANLEAARANAETKGALTNQQRSEINALKKKTEENAQRLANLQFAHEASGAALNAATRKLANANARAANLDRRANATNAMKTAALRALANAQAAHQQAFANVKEQLNATQRNAAQRLAIQAQEHQQVLEQAIQNRNAAKAELANAQRNREQARAAAANAQQQLSNQLKQANIARAELNTLRKELENLRQGKGSANAAVQATQAAVNAATETATNPNAPPENRNTARKVLNELQKIHNRLNKIPGKNQGSGMPPAIKIKFGNFRSGNVTQQTRTGGGGNSGSGGPPPGPAPGAAGGSGGGGPAPGAAGGSGGPPPPNSNANAERKKKLNLARRGRNLMYFLVDQYESGKLTRNQLLRRFTPQNRNRMSNALQNEPNALNAKYKNYLARMENIHKGDISEVSSKLNYKRVQNLLRNIQTQNGRNKGPARAALRTLRAQNQRWITMKRNMKYNQDPEVKRTINRVETEIKGSFGRGVNKFGRAVVQSLTPNERLTIQQRINKLKKNYTFAATQNQRNTIRQEMNQLKASLEAIKNKKNVSTSPRGNFNGNFNKASGEAERVDRIRALTQLLKKYPEQRTKIQAEITRTIRKIYRDPPYGTKNTNIRYNLEDVKRLVGGRSANINRELAQGLQRFVSKKSTNSSSNMLRLAPRFEAAPRLFEQGAPPPSMMMPAVRGAEAPGISVRVNAAPREVVQAATRTLPPMERFALENVGGVKKAANIINNAGGPLVIQKAARILQKNKGNVVRAMKTTGLSRRVFTNVEKLGGPKKVTRVIRATKKVAKKTTTVGAKAKKKSIPGKTKKKVLSTRSKKLKKVTITEKRLKTLIAQIPKKNLEKNVFKCALP